MQVVESRVWFEGKRRERTRPERQQQEHHRQPTNQQQVVRSSQRNDRWPRERERESRRPRARRRKALTTQGYRGAPSHRGRHVSSRRRLCGGNRLVHALDPRLVGCAERACVRNNKWRRRNDAQNHDSEEKIERSMPRHKTASVRSQECRRRRSWERAGGSHTLFAGGKPFSLSSEVHNTANVDARSATGIATNICQVDTKG